MPRQATFLNFLCVIFFVFDESSKKQNARAIYSGYVTASHWQKV